MAKGRTSKSSTKKSNPRTKKSAEAAKVAVPMTSKHEQIGENDLKNLLRRCQSWAKQGSEVTGQIGEAIKNAAENKNLDKKAFAIIRTLAKMEERNRLTTLSCLAYYIDVLKLNESSQAEADLKSDEPAEKSRGAGLHLAHDADAPEAATG